MKVTKRELLRRIEALEEWRDYADEMLTELNHALPDPEHDAKCAENAVAVEESLERHAVRLGLKKPKLKQLDQSVFDGLDEKWRWAAVDENSKAFVFSLEPTAKSYEWYAESIFDHKEIGEGYDTSDWQNSLIERKELTGSDLCRAMLERGDKAVLCAVSDDGDLVDGAYDAIRSVDEDGLFESHCSFWWYVQPINNQGEPLTASDVGL